jgi:protein-disulfide isomerase
MDMNRGHDIAEKIKVLASFVVVITTIYVGVLSVSSPNQMNAAMIRLSANTANNNNKISFHNLVLGGSPFLGKFSAPVTIVEFGDFQCDRCARFAKYTEPQLNQTYIQTGTANLVFKYFPIYGPDSIPAAMAAQCTNDQGKFWKYYDILFKDQGPPNFGWASKENLKKFASQIPGIDIQKFNSCFDSQKYLSFVQKDFAFATSLGLQGTPTFVIEKSDGSSSQILPGAYPFPSFKAIIDKVTGSV